MMMRHHGKEEGPDLDETARRRGYIKNIVRELGIGATQFSQNKRTVEWLRSTFLNVFNLHSTRLDSARL